MIQLTRLNSAPLVINSDLIECIENTPDTVITLATGQKFLVLESANDVIRRVVKFRRTVLDHLPLCAFSAATPSAGLRFASLTEAE